MGSRAAAGAGPHTLTPAPPGMGVVTSHLSRCGADVGGHGARPGAQGYIIEIDRFHLKKVSKHINRA
eukprot:gene8021-4989_t